MKILLNNKETQVTWKGKKVNFKANSQAFYISRNLFNRNDIDGTYSNKIKVISGQNYRIYRADTGGFNTHFRQIDENGKVLSDVVLGQDGCIVRDDAIYLQINTFGNEAIKNNAVMVEGSHFSDCYSGYNEYIECKKSKWNGKRWLVLGDSISTGNGSLASYQYASEPYHYLIAKDKGIITTNLSVSGYTTKDILEKKVYNLYGEYVPDLITVFCGVNDIAFSCDTETYYDLLILKLKELYPSSTIGVICPLDYSSSDDRLINKINIIKSIANKYNIKALDMYKATGWDFKKDDDVKMYTVNGDGLHPNNLGHSLMSKHINEFLENL